MQEEEREVLPVAEEQCGKELQELGAQIQQRKQRSDELCGQSTLTRIF